MIRPVLAVLSALAVLAVLPAVASADLLSTTIVSADAQQRDCVARPVTGAGVVQRTATATANGLVRATLSGASGDWDLAVFDRSSGRPVAGSASFGPNELAEGVASLGQSLTIQACRRNGSGSTAQLSVRSIPLPAPTGAKIQLLRVLLPTPGSRLALDATGVDQTEHARPGVQDVLAFGLADVLKLTQAGLAFTVVTPDVVAADRAALNAAAPSDIQPLPSGRTSYRRLADFSADMKALVEANPTLVRRCRSRTARSRAARCWASRSGATSATPPTASRSSCMMGVHHAREWPSAETRWSSRSTSSAYNSGSTAGHRAALQDARIVVVPIVNPDGFNLSRECADRQRSTRRPSSIPAARATPTSARTAASRTPRHVARRVRA